MNTDDSKFILLNEICSRIPYGLKCQFINIDEKEIYNVTVTGIEYITELDIYMVNGYDENNIKYSYNVECVKPYLRRMGSSKEEQKTLSKYYDYIRTSFPQEGMRLYKSYCNEHHLDNWGLLERNLALKAPEGMYND